MKRCLIILLCFVLLCGCGKKPAPDDDVSILMVDGVQYLYHGRGPSPGEVDPEAIIGQITSTVEAGQKPTQDGQSNFGCVGADYARVKEGIAVLIEHEWYIFVAE